MLTPTTWTALTAGIGSTASLRVSNYTKFVNFKILIALTLLFIGLHKTFSDFVYHELLSNLINLWHRGFTRCELHCCM